MLAGRNEDRVKTNRNGFRLVAGASLVFAAVLVGVPLGAQAVAPAASPTASPFRTATSFPTVNPSVYPTLVGTALAEMTRTAGTPQPPRMDFTQIANIAATQGARLQTMVASTPRTTPSPSGSATPTPDPCRSPLKAEAAYRTFLANEGSLSFDYPANWKVVAEYPQGTIQAKGVLIVNVSEACTSSFSHGLEARDFVTLKVEVVPLTLGKAATVDDYLSTYPIRRTEKERMSVVNGGLKGLRLAGQDPQIHPAPWAAFVGISSDQLIQIDVNYLWPGTEKVVGTMLDSLKVGR